MIFNQQPPSAGGSSLTRTLTFYGSSFVNLWMYDTGTWEQPEYESQMQIAVGTPVLIRVKNNNPANVYSNGDAVQQGTIAQYKDGVKNWTFSVFIMPDGDVEVYD